MGGLWFAAVSIAAVAAVLPGPVSAGGHVDRRAAALPPVVQSADTLGNATSNLPRIYRDGGGGGVIGGNTYIVFSDGIYSTQDHFSSDIASWANFTSNSIARISTPSSPTGLVDFGTEQKGPFQAVPFAYSAGESEQATGIWPQQNLVTLCDGKCAVSFPLVISRTTEIPASLYNTPVKFTISSDGTPVAERPTTKLFDASEPLFGTFSALTGIDGYLYLYAAVSDNSPANGLKLARVPQGQWADRAAYTYWDGSQWAATIPAKDDVASAVFKFSTQCMDETQYGPANGDVFWSSYYNVWLMVFQPADAGCDNNVYMSYSTELHTGWSEPVVIYQMPSAGGYSYSLHAYPTLDESGKTVALSFTQQPVGMGYYIAWAKITFA